MLAEIEDFIEGFNQPTYRGMRINGQRVATWSSRDGWSGDTRPDAEWLPRSKQPKGPRRFYLPRELSPSMEITKSSTRHLSSPIPKTILPI